MNFISDGLRLTPAEFAEVLTAAAQDGCVEVDSYSLGGAVARVESKFAQLLGKEQAVFLPTGTMANHLGLRLLAGRGRKVIVQADGHIYRDIGDAAQTLSGLNLIPLGHGQAGFGRQDVEAVLTSLSCERVVTRVGVIAIETPVRRHDDAMFGFDEIGRIAGLAREQGIGMHLDGARLFVEAVHTGIEPARYAALFDTVFVSLSKCFNSASGAILAGPASRLGELHHERRMFGGSLAQAWPQAAVALHYADGFLGDYGRAWAAAEALFAQLDADPRLRVESIPAGTHIVRLHVDAEAGRFRDRLRDRHIHLPPMDPGGWFPLKVNASLNRAPVADLAQAFRAAVAP